MTKRPKILANWRRLIIQPGDQIVLQCPHILTREQTIQLKKMAEEQFGHEVIILAADMKIGTIRRTKQKRTRMP